MSKFKGNRRIDYDGKDQYFTKRSVAQGYIEITILRKISYRI